MASGLAAKKNTNTSNSNVVLFMKVLRKKGKRGRLINPIYFGTFGTSQDLFQTIAAYLSEHYDLRETLIIANSDGEGQVMNRVNLRRF